MCTDENSDENIVPTKMCTVYRQKCVPTKMYQRKKCVPTKMCTDENLYRRKCVPTKICTGQKCVPTKMCTDENVYRQKCVPTKISTTDEKFRSTKFLPVTFPLYRICFCVILILYSVEWKRFALHNVT